MELGCESWTSFVSGCSSTAVQRTLSSTAAETATAQCTSRCAMARGHRLNTSIVLEAIHGLSGLFRAVSAVEPFTLSPSSPLSPSLISYLASVDVKQHGHGHHQNDSCTDSDESHFNVSFIVTGNVTNTVSTDHSSSRERSAERSRTEVLLLTSLTPYH